MEFRIESYIVLLIVYHLNGTQSLKSLVIKVPEYVGVNETVALSCEYDLETVALYTIKWYWKDVEFYRFVPKESPPSKAFAIEDFHVDLSSSGANEVILQHVQKDISGVFKCEVSADAPLFHTDLKGAVMNVIDVPDGSVHIEITPNKIEIGKIIRARCVINATTPAANFTWHVNNQLVETTDNVQIRPTRTTGDHIESRIEIRAMKSHFKIGPMVLRCDARLFDVWSRTAEGVVLEHTSYLAPVLLSTSSHTLDDVDDNSFDFFGFNAGNSQLITFHRFPLLVGLHYFIRVCFMM